MSNNESAMRTEVGGLKLKNPLMNSSGILGETWGGMMRVLANGAAAVVTKSTGPEEKSGNPMPVLFETECGLLNAFGLPNPGLDEMMEECTRVRARCNTDGAALILSIYGGNAEELSKLAADARDASIFDAVEINLSCPHAKGYGLQLGTDPETVTEVVRAVKGAFKGPVWAKLTPNVTDIKVIGRAAVDGGADAVVAVNTLKAIAIDAETMKPVLGNRIGGYSGRGIKPVALRSVWDLYEEVGGEVDIVGVGGITTGTDAAEFILAGARALQVGTAFHTRGDDAIAKILSELNEYISRKGLSIEDLVGQAHQ